MNPVSSAWRDFDMTASPVIETTDGRRRRSERSQEQIIDAMHQLLSEGDLAPSAARIAERAKVGLRTVFRHFEDMDTLYRRMIDRVEAEIMPRITEPYSGTGWFECLQEHVTRRCEVYEFIAPFRGAANLRRYHSLFLMEQYQRNIRSERETFHAMLPAAVTADPVTTAGLEVLASFQAWRTLRRDHGHSAEETRQALWNAMCRLLSGFLPESSPVAISA
jgi:AcrR family transcriptional regulator